MQRLFAAILLCATVAGTLAGCGASHNATTASVCSRLKADLANSSSPPQNLNDAKNRIKIEASEIKHDTADAKDASLRQAGAKTANDLTRAINQATSGTPANAIAAMQQAVTAARQLQTRCPGS